MRIIKLSYIKFVVFVIYTLKRILIQVLEIFKYRKKFRIKISVNYTTSLFTFTKSKKYFRDIPYRCFGIPHFPDRNKLRENHRKCRSSFPSRCNHRLRQHQAYRRHRPSNPFSASANFSIVSRSHRSHPFPTSSPSGPRNFPSQIRPRRLPPLPSS